MAKQKVCRAYARFECDVPVLMLGGKPLKFSYTSVRNFSAGGLYFEVSDPFEAGDFIMVRTDDNAHIDPISAGNWNQRPVKVRWCKALATEETLRYGCGVQYAGPG